ncbi:hypothetical protein [Nocardiopsis chromatogenes]|uniref:hypothetical protein n=1 Tax=Nocardiopsis chromatogenes TaxID=280239 RepID=UPI00034491C8|nr:hypothetical protein [Nocardiopsis chromatogenes]
MTPRYPAYPPPPAPPVAADHARIPGIAGLCAAVALLIANAVLTSFLLDLAAYLSFGAAALVLSVMSFRRPGNRVWAGFAFVAMMATPIVGGIVDYAAVLAEIE